MRAVESPSHVSTQVAVHHAPGIVLTIYVCICVRGGIQNFQD